MSKVPAFLLCILIFSQSKAYSQLSPDKRVVQYHNLAVPVTYQGNLSVLVCGLDTRPQITDNSQKLNFVGYLRSAAGVLWPLKTMSGNPFADDLAGSLALSLRAQGFISKATSVQKESDLSMILSKAQNEKFDRILFLKINDWITDQYDAGIVAHIRKLKYDIDLTVYDMYGSPLLKKKFNEPGMDLSKKGYAAGDYKTFIPEATKTELGKILNYPDLKNALTAARDPVSTVTSAKRIALVMGVKNYKYVQPLQNTLNDANDMASALKSKGFEVIEMYDPSSKKQMQDAIMRYFKLIQSNPNCAGMVFYSGHGMQVDGVNYLIPTESNPQIKADLEDQCLNMDYVMRAIEQGGNPLNIFVLDACRNNPFRGFYRSNEQGLNMVATPKGSYVVYATKPGAVASDGTGRNGLFTSKLLKHINEPGLNIEQVFKLVAADVVSESGDRQRPWIASDYTGNFYFTGGENDKSEISTIANAKSSPEIHADESKKIDAGFGPEFGYDPGAVQVVTIGSQQWLNKNLNVDHFVNGDKIDEVKANGEWEKAGKERKQAWCYFDNKADYSNDYGKLYNWFAAVDPRGLCPSGWRVPTDSDWEQLSDFLGGGPAELLKASTQWKNRPGNNSFNFSATPTGFRRQDGEFFGLGSVTFWWTFGKYGENSVRRKVAKADNRLERQKDGNGHTFGHSVRCIKNQ